MSTDPPTAPRFCPLCEAYLDADVCPIDHVSTIRADLELAHAKDPALGRVIGGRFRAERLLGEGAAGRVYAATQLSIGREVALKLLQPRHAHDRHHLRRFYREARAATRLTSQHVVQVFDFGVDDDTGAPYIAMELLRGETLGAWLAQHGPVTPAVAGRLLAPVARALIDASRAGIVHRDLKPSNIIVLTTGDGSELVKVTDFGIAKELGGDSPTETLTAHGAALGTPAYMAPEQATGGDVDHRADLYALGCILFEALTGRPPFGNAARAKLLADHLLAPAPPLPSPLPAGGSASPALVQLVAALLAKDPRDRPADARVVAQTLDGLARSEVRPAATTVGPPSPAPETSAAPMLPVPVPGPAPAPAIQRAPASPLPAAALAPPAPPTSARGWPARWLAELEHALSPSAPAPPDGATPSPATTTERSGFWPFSRRRRSAEERLVEKASTKRRRWLRHVRSFIAVNAGLLLLNVVTSLGDASFEPWFAYVAASWGIPFALHGLGYKAWREDNAAALTAARQTLGLPAPAVAEVAATSAPGEPAGDPAWIALIERCRAAASLAERDLANVPPDPYATVDPSTALRDGLAGIERLAAGAQRLQRTLGEVTPGRAEIRARIEAAELEASRATEPRLRKMIGGNLELLRAREHRLDQLETELMRMRVTVEGFALAAEDLDLDAARLGAPRLSELANDLAGPLRRLDQEVDVLNEVEALMEELQVP